MFIFKKIFSILWDFVETFVIAGAIFAVVYFFLARPFQVIGSSMHPTYKNGENVLTNLVSLRFSPLKRGDVIVFQALPPNQERDYIKRIIGLPGEIVMIQDGSVLINNQILDESSYLSPNIKTFGRAFLDEGEQKTVPPNSYFVLGDNRENSSDSREWGFVTSGKIIGKALFIYWPPQHLRVIEDPSYL